MYTHSQQYSNIHIWVCWPRKKKKTTYKRSNATFQHNKLPSLHTLKIFSRLNKDKHSPHEESKHFLSPTHYFLSMEKQLKISIFCLYDVRSYHNIINCHWHIKKQLCTFTQLCSELREGKKIFNKIHNGER